MGEAVQEVVESPEIREVPPYTSSDLLQPNLLQSKNTAALKSLALGSDNTDILFQSLSKKDLRRLARVKRIFVHYTSIDPLGDFIAEPIEVLDDRIKKESLNEVITALVSHARGAPLRALARSLGGPRHSPLFPVTNIVERSTHCIYGDVAGSEVTIGDEELMLERGVLLDSLTDTLLEEGQAGYFLLIAVGKSIIARCHIVPPRVGDGRALFEGLRGYEVSAQVLSLGASSEAHQCAQELGLSGENVREVESALHLDTLLERQEPFLLLTSDADCAEYVGRRGLVGYFSDQHRFEGVPGIACFRSFDLRAVLKLYERSRNSLARSRIIVAISVAGALLVAGSMFWAAR